VYVTWRKAPRVTVDDPWGFSNSLEWATSCPPPRHNFTSLPRIRSERPAFDLHHPEVAAMDFATPDQGFFDWESDHQGQRQQAQERMATGTGEPEQAAQGVVGDGVRPDDTEGRRR
jgi:cytochrome c oxidase subunit 1